MQKILKQNPYFRKIKKFNSKYALLENDKGSFQAESSQETMLKKLSTGPDFDDLDFDCDGDSVSDGSSDSGTFMILSEPLKKQ